MSLPLPTKTRIRYCNLNGVDIRYHVQGINVHETVCKPYITATLRILDKNNIINNMALVGGEPCTFVFDGNENRVYEATMRVLAVSGEMTMQNARAQPYTIELIGQSYFNDRANLIQQSFQGVTGTSAIQNIHSQYVGGDAPLSILTQSIGLLADKIPHIVRGMKPFKAIDDIRRTLNFSQYQTGNSLYYRDRDKYVLTALEHLFSSMSPIETFIQEETWGKSWFDIVRAERAIIAARAEVGKDQTSGRGSIGDLASVAQQTKTVFDHFEMFRGIDKLPAAIAGGTVIGTALDALVGGILQGKSLGGEPNFQLSNTNRRPDETDMSAKTEREALYAATAKGGPRISVKVPIQTGVNVTVGQGVNLSLLPPIGDQSSGTSLLSGNWLVIDLVHEVMHTEQEENYQATTTMRCIRGGYG